MKHKQSLTLFLKAVLFLIGIAALVFCLVALPGMVSRDAAAHPETAYLQYPFLICAYILFTPFFMALYQTFKLLSYIDKNQVFSEVSVKALKHIKYCALLIGLFFAVGLFSLALFIGEDIAGMITLCLICIFSSSIIATFTAVLQKLLKEAIEIKSENDLTV
ncbi:DUF2975 domain-containing protein [Planococcus sp. N028]|uniref:DUF2975 domain-containing protein n=1 Tax=Planococcus shixiaomingii TaxID=3058393 RepID=A0ABT8N5H1_9BACL|nr:DUF2975 domain-containing protein [Planococcus sp. N028]MDN7243133.1 DUF2975 domain-containing protein [Planococcus sp. N028]